MASVTEMPPVDTPETVESAPETPTKPPKTSTPPRGRPRSGTIPNPEPKFFDKVATVPKSDWGTRAFMYVYADEPVTNPKTFGQTRYMLKSHKPILDLEQLKEDYGSFKGWMTLNLRKTGKDQTDEVDRYDFEIYDPKRPPKIPKSAWANDARNRKWLDLLPPEKPTPSEGAATMLDAIKVYKEIREDVKDEAPPAAPPVDQTKSTLETMKLAKELFAPAAPAADAAKPADPLTLATELAKTFMQMKADNPMVDFLTKQMEMQHQEIMAMRKELQERQEKEKPAAQKDFLTQLMEFGGESLKTRIVSSLFGGAAAAAEGAAPVRAGRMTTLEFIADFGPKALERLGPLVDAFAFKVMNPASGAPGQTNGNGAPIPVQQVRASDPFGNFIRDIATPKMLEFFKNDPSKEGGDAFADWIYVGFEEYFERLQNFEHHLMPGLKGAAAIMTAYRNTPQVWQQIGPFEQQFAEFIAGFCEYKPERPEEEVIDTTATPAEGMEEGYSDEQERVS